MDEDLEAIATTLSADSPRFPGPMVMYFRTAGNLLRFTRQDFTLLPLVYVQTVIGLEKVLRLVYQDANDQQSLKSLLVRARGEGHFDGVEFLEWKELPCNFPQDEEVPMSDDPAIRMVTLIPELRNALLHGEYFLQKELLDVALQVRRMVDALILHLPPSWNEQQEAAMTVKAEQPSSRNRRIGP